MCSTLNIKITSIAGGINVLIENNRLLSCFDYQRKYWQRDYSHNMSKTQNSS